MIPAVGTDHGTGDNAVSDEQGIWLGLNGQKYGPYPEATVRAWRDEGKLAAATLAWRGGLAEWLPVDTLLPRTADAGFAAPSFDAPPPGLSPQTPSPPAFQAAAPVVDAGPPAPSLHWALVLLISVVTLGLFTLVWIFVHSTWVKKIDARSNATTYLIIAVVSGFAAGFVRDSSFAVSGFLQLAQFVLTLMGYFSMSASLKRFGAERQLPMDIGGVTLFFFTLFYFQGQLTRIARWQTTGVLEDAPKGIFWAVIGGLYLLGIIGFFALLALLGSGLR